MGQRRGRCPHHASPRGRSGWFDQQTGRSGRGPPDHPAKVEGGSPRHDSWPDQPRRRPVALARRPTRRCHRRCRGCRRASGSSHPASRWENALQRSHGKRRGQPARGTDHRVRHGSWRTAMEVPPLTCRLARGDLGYDALTPACSPVSRRRPPSGVRAARREHHGHGQTTPSGSQSAALAGERLEPSTGMPDRRRSLGRAATARVGAGRTSRRRRGRTLRHRP